MLYKSTKFFVVLFLLGSLIACSPQQDTAALDAANAALAEAEDKAAAAEEAAEAAEAAQADAAAAEAALEAAENEEAENGEMEEKDTEVVTLVINLPENEVSNDAIAEFEAVNPDIVIERIANDSTALNAAIAAGTPPDIIRTSAFDLPLYVSQGLVLDITDRMNASDIIDVDDLVPATNYFVIDGSYYGLPKDWSPDFSVFINTAAFEEAGLDIPSPDADWTYETLGEYARALTSVEGDRTLREGWNFSPNGFERMISLWLSETGQSLYTDDYSEIILSENEDAVEMIRFFYDLAVDGAVWTPNNPAPSNRTYLDGQSAMQSYGYWYGGSINGNPDAEIAGNALMLPAPSWSGEARFNPTWGPTGIVIAADSPNPDAAFRFFEWFIAGDPAIARASSGWGVPVFESLFELMPTGTELQQQSLALVKAELDVANQVIPINPYYSPATFTKSYDENLMEALNGNITFEELIANLESDVNLAIQDGILASQ